ncbi:reductase, iron-sulfur binding subunit, partial [Candidatus Thiomargarita nelsonii]
MAKANFETPAFRPYPVIPILKPGVMKGDGPFVAKPAMQEPLGYPAELVDNWQEVAIEKMGDLLKKYRSLRVYLDACVKCGACTDK